jgi:hypothetical protein
LRPARLPRVVIRPESGERWGDDAAPPIAFARSRDLPMRRLISIGWRWRGVHQGSALLALGAAVGAAVLAELSVAPGTLAAPLAAATAALLAGAHMGSGTRADTERRLARVRQLVADGHCELAIAEADAIATGRGDPANRALALELQARAWTSLGEAAEARRALESMPPGFSASPGLQGAVLLLEGRLDDARRQLERAQEEQPDDAVARALRDLQLG